MNNFDWDENERPRAYLITFRTYGTWLHGDERGAIDRHGQNAYGSPRVAVNRKLEAIMNGNQSAGAIILSGQQREVVAAAINETCDLRNYSLYALNVRTNHGHIVSASLDRPEKMLNGFKANATRALRNAGLVGDEKVWARCGSTRYLWKPSHVNGAIDYVLYGQGDDLPPHW